MLITFFGEISLVLFNSKIHSFIKTIQINHHVDFSSLVLVNISINTSWSAPSSILNPRHFIYWYSGRDYHFQKKILDFWWTINKQKSKIEKKDIILSQVSIQTKPCDQGFSQCPVHTNQNEGHWDFLGKNLPKKG